MTAKIYRVTSLSCSVAPVKAGQPFKLVVALDSVVQGQDAVVVLEKQREVLALGGFPELRPTGSNYFDLNPRPITVNAGSQQGTSGDIMVKTHPTPPQGDPAIAFPEQLVFTAFDVGTDPTKAKFRSVLVSISAP
jgi:hypothetical protein